MQIKIVVLMLLGLLLASLLACTKKASESVTPMQSQGFEEAIMLARNNGCLRCHQLRVPLVGPPWYEVAKRYQNSPEARRMLIDKVKRGGSGNWDASTGGAQMPAHANRVTDEHIEKIVDFILSLKIEE